MVTKQSIVSSFDRVKMPPKKKAGVNPDATGAKLNCIDDTAAPPRRKVNARQEHDLHYVENLHPYN